MEASSRWRFTVENEEASLNPSSLDDALNLAKELDDGELAATGDEGDYVQLRFNSMNAVILYMTRTETILRPRFPNHDVSGDGVDEFYCDCCGIELGDHSDLLAACTDRDNGFTICETILYGRLPESADIEWVPLRNLRKHGA